MPSKSEFPFPILILAGRWQQGCLLPNSALKCPSPPNSPILLRKSRSRRPVMDFGDTELALSSLPPGSSLGAQNSPSWGVISPTGSKNIKRKKKHTTPGIRWSSPTQLLVRRLVAYLWESGRDPEFSTIYGRMCLVCHGNRPKNEASWSRCNTCMSIPSRHSVAIRSIHYLERF